jgi:hypothetical protein
MALSIAQDIQCVHKVPSGFSKIVARKQIELATCGLRQITVILWKTRIKNAISAIPAVSTKSLRGFEKLWRANKLS